MHNEKQDYLNACPDSLFTDANGADVPSWVTFNTDTYVLEVS